jgi:multidrug resistance efflux pump
VTVRAQAVPAEELDRMGFEVEMAKARVESLKAGAESARARLGMAEAGAAAARAELELFRAGPWGPDLARAQAALDEAQARVSRIEREIERRIVRAPLAATVLCCNLRQGEYLSAGMPIPEQAPIVLGNIGQWRVRVDVDEFDAPRFKPGLPASAFFKGQATPEIKLEFAGVEPYIVPKRALTNSQHEVVDTRILQVLFRILPPHPAIFSGQQMDVFIQTP